MSYPIHPAAETFPLMEGDEFKALCADIRAHGLRAPLTLYRENGTVYLLDGRNRQRACEAIGLEHPPTEEYAGHPWDYVWSANVERRHLTPGQRVTLRIAFERACGEWDRRKAEIEAERRAALEGNRNASKTIMQTFASSSVARGGEERTMRAPLAKAAGVSVFTAQKAVTLAEDAPELFERVRAGDQTLNAAYTAHTRAKAAAAIASEPQPFPSGPFRVLAADPPWRYDKRKDDGTHRARLSYPDMTVEEICALTDAKGQPVRDLGAEDSILWLWTTNAHMRAAYTVLDAWGYAERTILTWAKSKMGNGDWLRGQTEHCILAVRGTPVVTLSNQTTLLEAPVREHSRKPDEFYALVESLCPGSRVELFAREARPGWARWGAEAPA